MRIGRALLTLLIIIPLLLALPVAGLWLFGSRTPVDTRLTFDASSIGPDFDAYLAEREARVDGIRPGLQKQIVWADPVKRDRTKIAFVYIHGFSASPGEVRPLPDILAREFGANIFFTRLTGHAATFEAMGTMTVNALVNDLAEAVAIGERLGDKVVIIASSSGATLASWGLAQAAFRNRIAAVAMMSPNYRISAFGSSLLTVPGAKELAHLLIGRSRAFEPNNAAHSRLWTVEYPVEALLPMAELVRLAVTAPVEQVTAPALFLISPEDRVVDPEATRKIAARWGGPQRLVEVEGVEDPSRHVLAGDALSPGTTEPLARLIAGWLREQVDGAR